jgi:hypothetical protein
MVASSPQLLHGPVICQSVVFLIKRRVERLQRGFNVICTRKPLGSAGLSALAVQVSDTQEESLIRSADLFRTCDIVEQGMLCAQGVTIEDSEELPLLIHACRSTERNDAGPSKLRQTPARERERERESRRKQSPKSMPSCRDDPAYWKLQ